MTSEALPFRRVSEVEAVPPDRQWLIESLWLAGGVGVLCGHAKVNKTFLAAQIAVTVAIGQDLFPGYPARLTGPVLFFGAEDSLTALRSRFDGLALVYRRPIDQLPIYLIDVPVLRIDREQDLRRLRASIEKVQPRLLILDPYVRIVAIDENSAGEVSAVLQSLRALQRDYDLAVLLVHHARKSPAAHPTQAFRGSSDLAAWSDTNLFLSRRHDRLTLYIEHRSARAPEPLTLRLETEPAPHLVLCTSSEGTPPTAAATEPLHQEVVHFLASTARPRSGTEVQQHLHRRKADVLQALEALARMGTVSRTSLGWQLHTTDGENGSPIHNNAPTTGEPR